MPDAEFALTIAQAWRGDASKHRKLVRGEVKSIPTLNEYQWRFVRHCVAGDVDKVARLLRNLAKRRDLCCLHGDPAPGVSPRRLVRRLSAESHGPDCTLVTAARYYIVFDIDSAPAPEGSAIWRGENIYAAAEYAREVFLPPPFRDVAMAIGAASSTGLKRGKISLHIYVLIDEATPLSVMHDYVDGAKRAGYPWLDPAPLLPGQLFVTSRPTLWGFDDVVPPDLWAFVLPGRRRSLASVDWSAFAPQLAVHKENERRVYQVGAELGWRAALDLDLGDGPGRRRFFKPISSALGHAARSDEPVDEIVGAMRALVLAHPDCNAERRDRYTEAWLRTELARMRAKDVAADARADAMRKRLFPAMRFD